MNRLKDYSLNGWSKEEKYNLVQAIKAWGSSDLLKIQGAVSTKTLNEVKVALDYYKGVLRQGTAVIKKKKIRKPTVNGSTVPLAKWTKVLLENLDFKELQTETATAIKIIAEFEDLPSADSTEGVDFKKVYYMVANALEGKGLKTDDAPVNTVINHCLVESALSSKQFIRQSTFKMILEGINVSEKAIDVFPKVTDNCELSANRHIQMQRPYNPLHIPEHYLKPTTIPNEMNYLYQSTYGLS